MLLYKSSVCRPVSLFCVPSSTRAIHHSVHPLSFNNTPPTYPLSISNMKARPIIISAAATLFASASVSGIKIARDHGHTKANELAARELDARQDLLAPYKQFTDIQLNIFQWDPVTCVSGTWAGSCAGYFDPAAHAGLMPVSISTAVIGVNGSPGHATFCGSES